MKRATKSAAKLVVLENYDRISAETEEIRNRIRERAFPPHGETEPFFSPEPAEEVRRFSGLLPSSKAR